MKAIIHPAGGNAAFMRQFLRWKNQEVFREFRALTKRVAETAAAKARELAPTRTGQYKKTIQGKLYKTLVAWVGATRKGKGNHGYLGGLLEYGTKAAPRHHATKEYPHLKKALEYAVRFHAHEIETVMAMAWRNAFGEYY